MTDRNLVQDRTSVVGVELLHRSTPAHGVAAYGDLDVDTALTLLHERYYLSLLRVATVLVDSQSSAEEVVQQAYVDILRRWDSVRRADDVAAYLRRAVINGARDRLRRRRTRRAFIAPHAVPEPSPEDNVVRKEQHVAVLDALATLPLRQREVLVLRHLSGLSEAETTAALGISVAAAKSAAHRGIATLRTRFVTEELI